MAGTRTRSDRCPGALRPWPAADGLLVRLRLIGGRVTSSALTEVSRVAQDHGDGRVHLTSRANLQLRGLPGADGRTDRIDAGALEALRDTGLLPSTSHELVRNVMVSPQTGLAGGRADLTRVATDVDRLLCADPSLADLPGRFLTVLDDGRGDLLERSCDLGLVALDATTAQLRVAEGWGPVVALSEAAGRMADLARRFVVRRGSGPAAPWHVAELSEPLVVPAPPDPRLPDPSPPLPHGAVPGGRHVPVAESGMTPADVEALTTAADHVVVTPWRGVLIPEEDR